MAKKQPETNETKMQIIKNIKLLALENNGIVTKTLYKQNKLKPSTEYISKHYGWENILREANVKPHTQLMSANDLIDKLKTEIKKLGYIPTRDEYEKLNMSPSVDSLSSKGIKWTDAMKKAGFITYGKPVKVKDKICKDIDCFNQFTPVGEQKYCEVCYKQMRMKLIKKLEKLNNYDKLKDIIRKLVYGGNNDNIIEEIFESI
jgi:hypothetical protein